MAGGGVARSAASAAAVAPPEEAAAVIPAPLAAAAKRKRARVVCTEAPNSDEEDADGAWEPGADEGARPRRGNKRRLSRGKPAAAAAAAVGAAGAASAALPAAARAGAGGKAVVVSQFTRFLDLIGRRLERAGLSFAVSTARWQ
jgi:hypothetical protein